MKSYLTTVLGLVCTLLAVVLIVIKMGDNAQQEKDAGTIADFSNRLDSAQLQIATGNGTMAIMSNSLDEVRSASRAFSNQLTEAQSAIVLDAEQITNLTRQVADLISENQSSHRRFDRQVMELTNQVTGLTSQIVLTESNLVVTHKNYALLENRLQRDVAERMVMERKFYTLPELQTQIGYLKTHPIEEISSESIYGGLGVEVTSNGFHVVSPD